MSGKVNVYKWEKLPKEVVRPGVSRTAFRGDNALMVMNWLEPGMEKKPHSHPFEQLAYVVLGKSGLRSVTTLWRLELVK